MTRWRINVDAERPSSAEHRILLRETGLTQRDGQSFGISRLPKTYPQDTRNGCRRKRRPVFIDRRTGFVETVELGIARGENCMSLVPMGISQVRVSQLMKQAREGGLITTKAARGKRRKA